MYLQGNLQSVFDALYEMGLIEPVLDMDWGNAITDLRDNPDTLSEVIKVINKHQGDQEALRSELEKFDDRILSYLAMEVAREFADFHARGEVH
ncbi:MAG: cytochrome [Bdellovibrionota bacterium]